MRGVSPVSVVRPWCVVDGVYGALRAVPCGARCVQRVHMSLGRAGRARARKRTCCAVSYLRVNPRTRLLWLHAWALVMLLPNYRRYRRK